MFCSLEISFKKLGVNSTHPQGRQTSKVRNPKVKLFTLPVEVAVTNFLKFPNDDDDEDDGDDVTLFCLSVIDRLTKQNHVVKSFAWQITKTFFKLFQISRKLFYHRYSKNSPSYTSRPRLLTPCGRNRPGNSAFLVKQKQRLRRQRSSGRSKKQRKGRNAC